MDTKTILVIEDDEAIRANVLDLLEAEGFDAIGASDGGKGLAEARRVLPDLIICDVMMPVLDGLAVLEQLRADARLRTVPFIFLTARAERADVRVGMTQGADDYVTKPFTRLELLAAVRSRLERMASLSVPGPSTKSPPSEQKNATQARLDRKTVILESPAMRALYDDASRAAQAPISVLILGETGAGKEVLAYEIHRRSPRAHGPFVPLNCAALSTTLLESELFGHEKGSFTGAGQAQAGIFETAHGGTVFLDEIGELSPEIQVKLLRVLEDRVVSRVGSRKQREVDVRFLAATNRDLDRAVDEGAFRRDLYFRLNGISLEIPPLRTRPEDLAPLCEYFVHEACEAMDRPVLDIADATLHALRGHPFPGNVRELKNIVDRAVALCVDGPIRPEHLPASVGRETSWDDDLGHESGVRSAHERRSDEDNTLPSLDNLKGDIARLERQRIIDALETCGGNQTQAAKVLGISRRTLVSRLDEYDLPRPRKGRSKVAD